MCAVAELLCAVHWEVRSAQTLNMGVSGDGYESVQQIQKQGTEISHMKALSDFGVGGSTA